MSYSYIPSLFLRDRERPPPTAPKTPTPPSPSHPCMQDIMYRWAQADVLSVLAAVTGDEWSWRPTSETNHESENYEKPIHAAG